MLWMPHMLEMQRVIRINFVTKHLQDGHGKLDIFDLQKTNIFVIANGFVSTNVDDVCHNSW